MKRIESSGELYDGINKILAKSSSVCTNFFLPQEETERSLASGDLFVHHTDSGILIYRRRETYYRTYFYLADPEHPEMEPPDLPAVLEIPYRDRDTTAKNAVCGFAETGFATLFHRFRMTRRGSEPDGLGTIIPARPDQLDTLMTLFRENFHPYAGCIPTEKELADEIAAGHILTDMNASGLLHFTKSRTGSELRHLAVAQSMRNRGIAGGLVQTYLSLCGSKKSTVWVREDNEPAIRTYEKSGYKADGMKSAVLIYGNN
ncbi:MAG: GNAT family N-acetyltransferase [Clostridia bacterium]|nr:GNAT family N-acetyltransferase [Clostridia bacterium]